MNLRSISTRPVRGEPDVFSITLYRIYPLPWPLVSMSRIQRLLVDASHGQFPLLVVTVSLGTGDDAPALGSGDASGSPCSGALTLAGEMETMVQTVSESCPIVMVLPATWMVPVRGAPVLFPATLYSMYPLPDPPEAKSCIQDAPVEAVQAHSALLAVTVTLGGRPAPPRGSFGSGRP